jgi:arylsulfatase A-like enzyme
MFKQTTLISIVLLLGTQFIGCKQQNTTKETQKRPNVILIMTDDQGYGDYGFHGNHHIKTPVLDNFAQNSISFTNFHVSPVCAPTRSSLMTGRYSLRTGVRDTYNGGAIMSTNEVTIAEILSKSGYQTGIFGKWHLGDNYPTRPMDQGFKESVVHLGGGVGQPGDYPNYWAKDSSYFDPTLMHNGVLENYQGYCSDVYTDEAIKYIKENSEKPFFIYLSYNAPHTPLQLPQEYYDMYKDIDPASGFDKEDRLPEMTEKDKEDARKVYGMVTNLDDNIGRVLKALKKQNIDENTLVIFLTDNGPQQRRFVSGMRGRKGMVYRGGVRVPCYMKFPKGFPEKKVIDVPTSHFDIPVMIASLCNAEMPADRPIDGENLLPLITEDKNKEVFNNRPLFFQWTRRSITKYHNMAVMKNGHKLAMNADYNSPMDKFELFNLENDPFEEKNIISENTELAKSLKSEIDSWYIEMISSPNAIETKAAIIGTNHENPVVLDRNDAKGTEGVWRHHEVYGYWDVKIAKAGKYNIKFKFISPLEDPGTMKFQIGPVLHTLSNKDTGVDELVMKNVFIPEIEGMLEPWYFSWTRGRAKNILPFTVEIEKI